MTNQFTRTELLFGAEDAGEVGGERHRHRDQRRHEGELKHGRRPLAGQPPLKPPRYAFLFFHRLPFTFNNYQLPTTIYQLPSTNYHLSTTNYHLPTTIYHLSTTNYHLSTTNYHLSTTSW